ncbi:tRNA dihydouriding synthase [Cryptosporidium ubiquitum]|uniref:tRNA dihydouriding synthase n=1 Tax=Cryptosporidium ubiquitum TaxID=857276 RepID=A0A1J4MCG0_9CRYT|nr:tRNA dihydouriding synthase [Cryptosporidium ubiquitum]OII71902.1 tRNA dihydouriding synthase [Cryptosporidium ubiquitum]
MENNQQLIMEPIHYLEHNHEREKQKQKYEQEYENKQKFNQKQNQNKNDLSNSVISVAPMLDVTNTHFRMLCRIISKRTELWTEMVVDDTIIHCYNDETRRATLEYVHFQKNESENPLVLQLGGNHPEKIEKAIEIAFRYGFRNFNLNVGCPSCKVASKGSFGASLFKDPLRVASIVDTCNKKFIDLGLVNTRISIKTRIGVDQYDTYQHLYNFISLVSGINVDNQNKSDYVSIFPDTQDERISLDYSPNNFIGADTFIIHTRKAWLNGINPSKNRTIPKLKYYWVYMLTLDFPSLTFILNGGVTSIEESISILTGDWYMKWYLDFKDIIQNIEIDSNKTKKIKTDNDIIDDHSENSTILNSSIALDDYYMEKNKAEDYERVYQAIRSGKWMNRIKGIMIGREVMNNPFVLSKVDSMIYGINETSGTRITRRIVLEKYCEYLSTIKPRDIQDSGKFTIGELNMYLKPVFGLFHGFSGTKYWRRTLSEFIQRSKKDDTFLVRGPREILLQSLDLFEKEHSDILDLVP